MVPTPFLLFTLISPPKSSTRDFVITKPNPVPPYFRVVESSSCLKGSNISSSFSETIPIPVSEISNCMLTPDSVSPIILQLNIISPFSVNFIALLRRLIRICFNRFESDNILSGILLSKSQINSTCSFVLMRTFIISMTSLIKSSKTKNLFSIPNSPASIFEKSSMSLIIFRSVLPLLSILRRLDSTFGLTLSLRLK